MRFENGDVIFETTGRREYCFGENLSCHPDSPGLLCYGSDGALPNRRNIPLTQEERKEAAEFMIKRIHKWLAADPDED